MKKEIGLLMKPEMVNATLEDRKSQTRRPVTFHNSTTGGMVKRKDWHELRWDEAWLDVNGPSPAGNPGPYWHVPFRDIVVRVYPRVQPGDRLWVRETWRVGAWNENATISYGRGYTSGGGIAVDYKADNYSRKEWIECEDEDMFERLWVQSTNDARSAGLEPDEDGDYYWDAGQGPCRWRPSIHMPRWACRLDLNVLKVRSQLVQDISSDDARAEGAKMVPWFVPHGCKDEGDHKHVDGLEGVYKSNQAAFRNGFATLWDSINAERGFSWSDNHPVWIYDFKRIDG